MKKAAEAVEGEWDFEGSCAPREDGSDIPRFSGHISFTLGCFQWVRRGRDGQGSALKKGTIQHRVKGRVEDPGPAYAAARAFCERKNDKIGTLKEQSK
jgi:hypothetical protein